MTLLAAKSSLVSQHSAQVVVTGSLLESELWDLLASIQFITYCLGFMTIAGLCERRGRGTENVRVTLKTGYFGKNTLINK